MKLTKFFTAVLLFAAIAMVSCKGKSTKDLLVNKWKFTEISGKDAAQIPDSIKANLYKNATMEFKKDGSYESAGGMGDATQKGTYSVSDDGKCVISKTEGTTVSDTMMIIEISKDKLVVEPKDKTKAGDMKLTMTHK